MCGIVGILGKGPVAENIVEALRRLEYRGYDSAGVATLENGAIDRRRAVGKLKNLAEVLQKEPLKGSSGIGHTRWATHGGVTETNAHPHIVGDVVIVHNGIIENFRQLKDELIAGGATFTTQTDTEVVAQLIARERKAGKSSARSSARCAEAPAWSFCAGHPVQGRKRPADRRPQWPAAGRWPWRRRNVSGIGRHCAFAVHQPHHLSGRWRLGGAHPHVAGNPRRR